MKVTKVGTLTLKLIYILDSSMLHLNPHRYESDHFKWAISNTWMGLNHLKLRKRHKILLGCYNQLFDVIVSHVPQYINNVNEVLLKKKTYHYITLYKVSYK